MICNIFTELRFKRMYNIQNMYNLCRMLLETSNYLTVDNGNYHPVFPNWVKKRLNASSYVL